MNLAPIADAPLAIKIHLATVIPAFAIGTWLIFFSTKGARWHRVLGAVYLTLMIVTAVAAFFIRSLNPGHLTLIHLFIPLTAFGCSARCGTSGAATSRATATRCSGSISAAS
jgi:uncharacterized membrane protein